MYWIVSKIGSSKGIIEKEQFHALEMFSQKTIDVLIERGGIRVIKAPPVQIMTELKKSATILKRKGIKTLLDLIRIDSVTLADILKIEVNEAENLQSKATAKIRPDTQDG